MHYDIFIRPENIKKAQNNDRVIVEILEGPSIAKKNPEGKINRSTRPYRRT